MPGRRLCRPFHPGRPRPGRGGVSKPITCSARGSSSSVPTCSALALQLALQLASGLALQLARARPDPSPWSRGLSCWSRGPRRVRSGADYFPTRGVAAEVQEVCLC